MKSGDVGIKRCRVMRAWWGAFIRNSLGRSCDGIIMILKVSPYGQRGLDGRKITSAASTSKWSYTVDLVDCRQENES